MSSNKKNARMETHQNDNLDILSQIKKVDAPHFLFTRISQKIANKQNERLPKKFTVAFALLIILIFAADFVVINTEKMVKDANFDAFGLTSNNQFYNE